MGAEEQLLPPEIVSLAESMDRRSFGAHFEGDKLFMVGLAQLPADLLDALRVCSVTTGQTWFPRSEGTGTGTALAMGVPLAEIPDRLDSIPPPFDGDALLEVLAAERHFVMPVRKRPGSEVLDPERISVGRSRANDVVLAHQSVSKVHAYLEYDDRDRLYVSDASSTNFTRVRGRIVDAYETVNFALGEPVQFGEVTVRVVSPETLWDALTENSST